MGSGVFSPSGSPNVPMSRSVAASITEIVPDALFATTTSPALPEALAAAGIAASSALNAKSAAVVLSDRFTIPSPFTGCHRPYGAFLTRKSPDSEQSINFVVDGLPVEAAEANVMSS
jgi:hypothetical protein